MPPGADTVVIQENTSARRRHVVVGKPTAQRAATSAPQGLDFAAGAVLLRQGPPPHRPRSGAGRRHEPPDAAGAPRARRSRCSRPATSWCRPAPRPGPARSSIPTALPPWRSRAREGGEVVDLGIAPDRLDETIAAIRRARASGADILVTTGGASVGDYDLVQQALAGRRARAVVLEDRHAARPADDARPARRHARARPARQSGLGLCLRVPVPGAADPAARGPRRHRAARPNRPCSAATCRRTTSAPTTCAPRSRAGPTGRLVATPLPVQDSSMLAPLAAADCLLIRAPHAPAAKAGSRAAADP